MACVAPELLTLLIAERLARERLHRLRGYPDDVVKAAESLWREAAQAIADYRSTLEKAAIRMMRKVYEATGGQPQRWESLGNLGTVAADAAGIAYAVEKGLAHHFRRPSLGKPYRGRAAAVKVSRRICITPRARVARTFPLSISRTLTSDSRQGG